MKAQERDHLLAVLKRRCEQSLDRHKGVAWANVLARIDASTAALQARTENKPPASAIQMAADMGVELLSEDQYRMLQPPGEFDTKTNGAQSYCAARGVRALLRV